MERRVSYILLGSFVLILSISLAVFLFWLLKYGESDIKKDYYKTYFYESVSGLSVESPVKFRGVEVGRVKDIEIDREDSRKIEVLLEIKAKTPIKEDNYAVLGSLGITGLKYVEIKGGSRSSKLLNPIKNSIPVIASKKSALSAIFDNSESITEKFVNLLDKIDKLLSDKNIKNASNIIENISNSTKYLDNNKKLFLDSINKLTKTRDDLKKFLDKTSKDFNLLVKHTNSFEDDIVPSFKKLGEMSDKVGKTSDTTKLFFETLNKKAKDGEFDMATIVKNNTQILNETIYSIRGLTLELKSLTKELKRSPSDIIYKSRDKVLGPGESR